jgi:Domain of unknown function (DUF1707)
MDSAARDFPPGDLRVSDADRDRALSELSRAFQVGRITADEFDQRSGQALGARTGKELTALLADLPPDRVPAVPTTAVDRALSVLGARRAVVASALAVTTFAGVAVMDALSHGPTLAQREQFQAMAARHGPSTPLPPAAGFNWPGTITPAVVAVLFVVLIIFLHATRADRPQTESRTPTAAGSTAARN